MKTLFLWGEAFAKKVSSVTVCRGGKRNVNIYTSFMNLLKYHIIINHTTTNNVIMIWQQQLKIMSTVHTKKYEAIEELLPDKVSIP